MFGRPKSGAMASESVDDYLKAIYELTSPGQTVATSNAIAAHLSVSAPSVTNMLQKLSRRKPALVSYRKHHGAALTVAGTRRALGVIRRHRLVELFLHDVLGYAWDEVHSEAEKLEHVISAKFEERLAQHLGNPEFDPHGQPIPSRDGSLPPIASRSLDEILPGTRAVVSSVADRNPAALRYLKELGIRPGVAIELLERGPIDGPIVLRVGAQENNRAISLALGRQVQVATEPDQR